MQRLFNVNKWKEVTEGAVATYGNPKPRKVVLEVNAPEEVALYLVDPENKNAEIAFLANVKGRDTIEFWVQGPFSVTVDGGSCFVYTVDGDIVAFEKTDDEIYTRIAERRRRNPDVEYIMTMMHANLNRRLEQQKDELERTMERRIAARTMQLEDARTRAAARAGVSGVPGAPASPPELAGEQPAGAGLEHPDRAEGGDAAPVLGGVEKAKGKGKGAGSSG